VRRGQVVDVALFESVFNMLEAVVPEYDRNGVVRGPSGATISGVVPSNTFRCRCGRFVVIAANGLSNYRRLMNAAGRPDLADDPRLATNAGRVEHQGEIDDALAAWAATLDASDLLATLAEAAVPAGPIYSVADMMGDEHYRARGLFEQVEAGGRSLALPAILPKLSDTPGRTDWAGPPLGAHNAEVLGGWLGLSEAELAELVRDGVL
jgi:crotonobetainyl-CoA:carnitine CoA-transferase CaiB-like acyl-CoA transferase